MNEMTVSFNGQTYNAIYNSQTGYYEVELQAPTPGGIYQANIEFTDLFEDEYTLSYPIQVFVKDSIKVDFNKVFMWIFDYYTFEVKDIVELSSYEIDIDEEANTKSLVKVLKNTGASANDIVSIKKNNEVIYWGIIEEITNEDGAMLFVYTLSYITNLFDRKIQLKNENIIRATGVEDFIETTIDNEYISNSDTFINLPWLEISAITHTPKETVVSNVENGIYNLHTWITNCTQNYNIVYSFNILNGKLSMEIENKTYSKQLIDTKAQSISEYTEVFETDITSKVIVLYNKKNGSVNPGNYTLYLLNDRTTTTDGTDVNRAKGKIETVYTENYEDANQEALNVMKSNAYNHNITFNLYDKYIKIGTPIAIKTKESLIYDSYISAIKMTSKKFYEYTCGNIRINFIDKLLKERSK